MTAGCDPCGSCANLYAQSVYVGGCGYGNRVTEEGCDEDIGDWEPGCGSPCPGFKPILASESLMEQIADEEECRFWMEMQMATEQEGCE